MSWKDTYAVASLAGFILICWGFGLAREQPQLLHVPPLALRRLNALITLAAFVLVAAACVPRNHFRAKLGHPMLAGTAIWAFGHLLATGMRHDLVLFGAFLLWAAALFVVSRRRDRNTGTTYASGTFAGDAATIAIGFVAWAVFAFWLHLPWIGVSPFV